MLRYVWLTGPLYKSFCFTNERECFCKHLHCFAYAKNERSVRYVRLAYVWLIITFCKHLHCFTYARQRTYDT